MKSAHNMMTGQAIGAVVAQQLYTLWVGGSNPSSPTILFGRLFPFTCGRAKRLECQTWLATERLE
jgi:hypothetical protein